MKLNEAQAKANAGKLVKGDHTYNMAQSQTMKDEIIGSTFETRAGKLVEVVEHTNHNNIVIKVGDEYDAVAGVWFIAQVERGSFVQK